MGNGIAHVFAQSGFNVQLFDISEAALDRALLTIGKNMDRQVAKERISESDKNMALERLSTGTDLAKSVSHADLIVEAATENKEIKFNLFKQLDELAHAHCILSSNTSSISITKIVAQTNRPDKVIGMHFMNPVPVMKLVEIIRGYSTSDETMNAVVEMSTSLGKVPVACNDYPGFVANRILMPMINEAIISLHEGVAGVEEIDTIMKLGMARCPPEISLTIAAPDSIAVLMTPLLKLSIEIRLSGKLLTTASTMGMSRFSSSSSDTKSAPGRELYAPISIKDKIANLVGFKPKALSSP